MPLLYIKFKAVYVKYGLKIYFGNLSLEKYIEMENV